MQKGLILYMGYYGRYTAAYSIGCLLMLSLYIAGIFLHWAAFGVLLVLTLAGVMLLAGDLQRAGHAPLQCGVPSAFLRAATPRRFWPRYAGANAGRTAHAAQPGIE